MFHEVPKKMNSQFVKSLNNMSFNIPLNWETNLENQMKTASFV
jgi:hypothetical protein